MNYALLPHLNAALNSLSAVLLVCGFIFILRRNVTAHLASMIAAFVVSALFLVSYLIYHAHVGSTRFTGEGLVRPVYFFILITHIILAAVILPLILLTLRRAWRGEYARHRRIARWTFPLWLYVSVTGVIVYFMLYHLYPSR